MTMRNFKIHRLSSGQRRTQLTIQDLCEREGIDPLRALAVMAVEENNYKAGQVLGCSAFGISLMRGHLTELLRLLLHPREYRYLMGNDANCQLQAAVLTLEQKHA